GAMDQGRAFDVAQQLVEGSHGSGTEVGGAGDGQVVVGQAGRTHGVGFVEAGSLGVGGEIDDVDDAGCAQGGQVVGADAAAGSDARDRGGEAFQCGRLGGGVWTRCGRARGGGRGGAADEEDQGCGKEAGGGAGGHGGPAGRAWVSGLCGCEGPAPTLPPL